jgi:hypothetical protein
MQKMTLAKRDLYLVRIDDEMSRKKKYLLDKYNSIGELEEENEYLRLIRDDYNHYYGYIKKEKQDQIDAMNLLRSYIDNLIVDGKLTDDDLESTQTEQEKILNEIDTIKRGLDEITHNYGGVEVAELDDYGR